MSTRKNRRSVKRSNKRVRKNPTGLSSESISRTLLARKYTDLHEGRGPDQIVKETLPSDPKYFVELGEVPELLYWKKTPDGEHPYKHKFAAWAMPTLVHDEKGKLHIVDQDRLIVTERGIEDNMAKRHSRKRSIMRANPTPHRGARMLSVRRNPFNAQTVKKVAVSSLIVGGLASLTMIGLGIAAQKWKKADGTPMLTGYKLAGAQAGLGIGLSLLAQGAIGGNAGEILAAGVGIGGVAAAVNQGWVQYQLDHPAQPAAGIFVAPSQPQRVAA